VVGVNSPRWSDDDLLRELGAALREEPVDESIIRAAEAAFTWRTIDAELEIIALDTDSALAGTGRVRGQPDSTRTLIFHGDRVGAELEIDEAGIIGQLTPPGPGQVTLFTPDGPQATTQTDEVGVFTFPRPPSGPIRLKCVLGDDDFITEWTTL
jgi:hypothetical protein